MQVKNTTKRKIAVATPGGLEVLKPGQSKSFDEVLNLGALENAGLDVSGAAEAEAKAKAEAEAKAKAEAEAKAKAEADAKAAKAKA